MHKANSPARHILVLSVKITFYIDKNFDHQRFLMRVFHPVNSLIVTINLANFIKLNLIVFNLSQTYIKKFQQFKYFNSVVILFSKSFSGC